MLLKKQTLEGIRAGDITLVFRRWKRPTVKQGGTLKTAVGVLTIHEVKEATLKSISEKGAKSAGFESRAELLDSLRGREGKLYRVRVEFRGADPRVALRKKKASKSELADLREQLEAIDARSRDGEWAFRALRAIHEAPAVGAVVIAESLGMEKVKFKQRVRRLKELGLTESLKVGYRLSPRGQELWKSLSLR